MTTNLTFARSPVREMMKRNGAQLVAQDAVTLLIDHIEQAAKQLTKQALVYAQHAKRKKITRDDILLATKYTIIKHKMKKEHYVIAVVKVLPDDVYENAHLEKLVGELKNVLTPLNTVVEKFTIVPIAFGLQALRVQIRIPEETEGGTQPAEDAMESLGWVQRVEVEMVTRL
ncbi:MAG: elongation factor 1-beta [Candidatus Lokiarchaeota archaeon]|nr:elongation factor 1-beta [Candidatus Lokiarchaeota archaeon]